MDIRSTQEEIIKEFESFQDWDERYMHIIKMGRELEEYPEEFRIDKYKIEGCQSQVWMNAMMDEDRVVFHADSDAMIVKGLIALLLKVYSLHKPEEILSSPPEFIKKIGIENHLSPTRRNGLGAMLKQIKMYALAFKALKNGY